MGNGGVLLRMRRQGKVQKYVGMLVGYGEVRGRLGKVSGVCGCKEGCYKYGD